MDNKDCAHVAELPLYIKDDKGEYQEVIHIDINQIEGNNDNDDRSRII